MIQKSEAIKLLGAILLTLFCQKGVSATELATVEPEKEVSADMAPLPADLLPPPLHFLRGTSFESDKEMAAGVATLADSSARIAKSALRRQTLVSDAATRLTSLVDTTSSLVDVAEEKSEGYLSSASAYLPSRDTLLSVGTTAMAGGIWVAGKMWSERRYEDVYKVSVVKKEEPMSAAWERLEPARAELIAELTTSSEEYSKLKAAERRYSTRYTETEVREKIGTTLTTPSFRESLPSDMKLASGLATGLISGIRLGLAYMKKKEFIAEIGVPAATGATHAAAGAFAASAAAAAGQVALATQHATFAAGAIPAAFAGAEIASQATSLAQNQLCNVSLAEASPLINHQLRELTDLSASSSQVEELLRQHLEYLGVAVKGNSFNLHEFRQAAASRGAGSPIGPEWDLNNFWASSSKSLLLKNHLSKVNARGVKVRFIGALLGVAAWAALVYGDLLPKWLKNLATPLMTFTSLAGLQGKSVGVPAVKKEITSSSFWGSKKTTKEQKEEEEEEEPKKLPIGWIVVALASILAALAAFAKKK